MIDLICKSQFFVVVAFRPFCVAIHLGEQTLSAFRWHASIVSCTLTEHYSIASNISIGSYRMTTTTIITKEGTFYSFCLQANRKKIARSHLLLFSIHFNITAI